MEIKLELRLGAHGVAFDGAPLNATDVYNPEWGAWEPSRFARHPKAGDFHPTLPKGAPCPDVSKRSTAIALRSALEEAHERLNHEAEAAFDLLQNPKLSDEGREETLAELRAMSDALTALECHILAVEV